MLYFLVYALTSLFATVPEKSLIKFKSLSGVQKSLSLMEKVRNIFAINVGRYTKNFVDQRLVFDEAKAKAIWDVALQKFLAA